MNLRNPKSFNISMFFRVRFDRTELCFIAFECFNLWIYKDGTSSKQIFFFFFHSFYLMRSYNVTFLKDIFWCAFLCMSMLAVRQLNYFFEFGSTQKT